MDKGIPYFDRTLADFSLCIIVCMTQYDAELPNVWRGLPHTQSLDNTLGEYLSSLGREAAAELPEPGKYAHVFFFKWRY